MARTERESDNRRRKEEKWQTCWYCRHQRTACRMPQASAERLEHIGPAEKERVDLVSQREQLARTPEPPFAKRKRNRAVCPEYQIMRGERVKVGEWRTLVREGGSEREHGEEKVDSTVNEGRFQGGKEG